MNTLPEHLISKIRLYTSHPCADIIRNALQPVDGVYEPLQMIQATWKRIPNPKFTTPSLCILGITGTAQNERSYESEGVKLNIHNRFKLTCITEDYLEQLKTVNRVYRLYLHFNRELIDGLLCVEDVESDSCDYCLSGGLDEHAYLQQL